MLSLQMSLLAQLFQDIVAEDSCFAGLSQVLSEAAARCNLYGSVQQRAQCHNTPATCPGVPY